MRGSFARQRLHGLLTSQAFGAAGALVACVADMVIAGNLVGVDAMSGIAAVVPVTIGAQFVARLVYCGAGYLFAKCQGEMAPDRARRVVGLSIEASVAVGALILVASLVGRDSYLDLMGITGAVREQAALYWRWIFVYHALSPLTTTMWRLVYADGETVTTAVADLLSPPLTIGLSILFTKMTGSAAGAALGILVGVSATDLIMMFHLFRKTNAVVPAWNFSIGGLRELVSYSLTDSSTKLCQCGFMAVVNKLVVATASSAYLPVAGMIALILQLRDMLDRIGDAYAPVAEMYLGERNLPRVSELAHHALSVAFAIGLAAMVAVGSLAPQIVALYGIPKGDVFNHSVIALRICALALPLSSVRSFLCSHYLVMDRIGLAVANTVSDEFMLTAGCATVFCLAWGLDAIWIGLPAGGLLTLVATFAYGWLCSRRKLPLLVPEGACAVRNLTFSPDASRIVRVRDEGERFLRQRGVVAETVSRIMLLVEECSMAVAEHNRKGASRIRVEASFLVDRSEARLVLRDTGAACDITDGDAQVTSLRSFVIAGLMKSFENRRYLNTIGCNRAVFAFANPISEANSPKQEELS